MIFSEIRREVSDMWRCILCSSFNFSSSQPIREASNCRSCGSTWRARSVTLNLLAGLGYPIVRFDSIKSDWSRIGLGISDDINVASRVATKFFYSNSYYDVFPLLDIRKVPSVAKRAFEFVICSDVLEHIDTGLDFAVEGIASMLKPNGFAVISVPILVDQANLEFYPNLSTFEILNGEVHWTDTNGEKMVDTNPEFHGGRGQNLAFRQFTDDSITSTLLNNGFSKIIKGMTAKKYGVHENQLSGVYIARVE